MTSSRAAPTPLALLILLLCACARPDAPLAAGGVAGCWELRRQAADTALRAGVMPDSVRLDSAVTGRAALGRRRIAFAGRSVPSGTLGPGDDLPWHRAYHASWWEVRAGDSIRLVFNDNHARNETDVRVRGGRLQGTATFRTHEGAVPPPAPALAVHGERFPCPDA